MTTGHLPLCCKRTKATERGCIGVQLELRDVRTGRKTLERLRPYDMMEVVRVDSTPFQYLFQEGDF